VNNKGLLTIIAVVLIGILAILLIQANQKSPAEQAADSISSVAEDIGDEIRREN